MTEINNQKEGESLKDDKLNVDLLSRLREHALKMIEAIPPQPIEHQLTEKGKRIIQSLIVGEDGSISLVIPAGISDIDAMKALNSYYLSEVFPNFETPFWEDSTPIDVKNYDYYESSDEVKKRSLAEDRICQLQFDVPETLGKEYAEQLTILSQKGMRFASQAEIALIIAACACRNICIPILAERNWFRTGNRDNAFVILNDEPLRAGIPLLSSRENKDIFVGNPGSLISAIGAKSEQPR